MIRILDGSVLIKKIFNKVNNFFYFGIKKAALASLFVKASVKKLAPSRIIIIF